MVLMFSVSVEMIDGVFWDEVVRSAKRREKRRRRKAGTLASRVPAGN
jgi:hypothetical protein